MNFYPEMQIVEIAIPFKDASGVTVVPTEIKAVLRDGEEDMVLDFGSIAFDATGVDTKVIVPALANTLRGDDLMEVRKLDVEIVHAGGVVRVSRSYVIEAEQSLQIMRNSFMSFETALMLSTQFVNLTAFVNATEQRQRAALTEAFYRIIELPMVYATYDADGAIVETSRIGRSNWMLVDADAFKTQFPSHFQRALRAAQLAEADDLLQGNVLARKHAQGIASETIGESSVTLRQGFGGGITSGIGTTALALLSGYIDRTMTIGRA